MTHVEPSADQLSAMAYADGEMDAAARAGFEARLAREPELAREVAAHQRLHVLAREVAPPEPEDFEWARIARSPLRRAVLSFAVFLALVGSVGVLGYGEWCLLCSDAPVFLKWAVSLALVGFSVWFGIVARDRMRTRAFDPYTGVKR
ncbi:MAG: hypothetical protein JNL28_06730 [Planctomycetes bacterium]|nr:hypothetical protein [Planctomycetota bacterium]